jgi:hypothetical protein
MAAMVLMLLGIGLFSAITASIASYFISEDRPRAATRADRIVAELERLADLRRDGSLTEAEFATAMAGVLGR